MIDTELLREYSEWSANNLGRMVDVSPEAFALHKAIDDLMQKFADGSNDDTVISMVAYLAEAWRVLNAPTD